MLFRIIILLFLLLSQRISAQVPVFGNGPAQLPAAAKLNFTNEMEKTSYFLYKAGIPSGKSSPALNYLLNSKLETFNSGHVYLSWEMAQNYLDSIILILTRAIPDTFKYEPKAYLFADNRFNAAAMYDGTIFFNIGSFLYVENEAEIAAILAHEIAHYTCQHTCKGIRNEMENKTDGLSKRKRRKVLYHQMEHNRAMELEADSIGFIIFSNSGYSANKFLTSELKLNKYVDGLRRYMYVHKRKKDLRLNTHPDGTKRVEFAKRQVAQVTIEKDSSYIVSQSTFNLIKKQAKTECMAQMLQSGDYLFCIEMGYLSYLTDTSDNSNIYYLLESIRRYAFGGKGIRYIDFLYGFYAPYDARTGEPTHNVLKTNLSIALIKRLSLLYPDIDWPNVIQDKYLELQTVGIKLYSEHFEYFSKIAKRKKITEALLTSALYHLEIKKKKLFNQEIQEYISTPGARYVDYANYIYKGVNGKLNSPSLRKAIILNNVLVKITNSDNQSIYGYHYQDSIENEQLRRLKDDLKKDNNSDIYTIADLVNKNNNLAFLKPFFDDAITWSWTTSKENIIGGSFLSLNYLDPSFYYNFFSEGKYNEVAFVDVEITLEISDDMNELISSINDRSINSTKTREVSVIISALPLKRTKYRVSVRH